MMLNLHTIENGKTILLSGDSVTDCGRARPYGDYVSGLGGGYPQNLHTLITATCPEKRLRLVNAGIGGRNEPRRPQPLGERAVAVAPTTRRCSSASTTFGGTSTPI